jgi:ribonuclease BN (tRNA processing enzyme)
MNGLRPLISARLVNGSTGDSSLFVDYPGRDDAILFDAGENCSLDAERLGDLRAVFLSHHHVDHFIGFLPFQGQSATLQAKIVAEALEQVGGLLRLAPA